MTTLTTIRARNAEILARISAHGYDLVGTPRPQGGAIFLSFRRGDDERELAEGELSFWADDLDRAVKPKQLTIFQ